jgi:RNA polymerase sigma-70 factor (ECF subfamily)
MYQSNSLCVSSLAIFESHAPVVLAYLLRQVRSREEAEDLLLEVFTVVLEKESALPQDERACRAWILTIARRKAVDSYRRFSHFSLVPLEKVEERIFESEEGEPEYAFLLQEAHTQLQNRVQKLTKLQQEVLWLQFR